MAFSINNFLHVMYDPSVSEEVYKKLTLYLLTEKERRMWGYPIKEKNGEITCKGTSKFQKSSDPTKQRCRCGKDVSLMEKDWYLDERGCYYHSSRANYADLNLYSCCKSNSSKGCTFNKYHVCDFKATDGNFIQSQKHGGIYKKHPCNIFALDCEMVYTTKGMELARVTLVALNGRTVLDSLVKPAHLILDYNTKYSGVTSKQLEEVSTTLEDIQKSFLDIINEETMLIGHSLEQDLISLQVYHENIIDVASVFPHQKGFPYRMSLKSLAEDYICKSIQDKSWGHDSIEDSITCIELLLWKMFGEKKHISKIEIEDFNFGCYGEYLYYYGEEEAVRRFKTLIKRKNYRYVTISK